MFLNFIGSQRCSPSSDSPQVTTSTPSGALPDGSDCLGHFTFAPPRASLYGHPAAEKDCQSRRVCGHISRGTQKWQAGWGTLRVIIKFVRSCKLAVRFISSAFVAPARVRYHGLCHSGRRCPLGTMAWSNSTTIVQCGLCHSQLHCQSNRRRLDTGADQ